MEGSAGTPGLYANLWSSPSDASRNGIRGVVDTSSSTSLSPIAMGESFVPAPTLDTKLLEPLVSDMCRGVKRKRPDNFSARSFRQQPSPSTSSTSCSNLNGTSSSLPALVSPYTLSVLNNSIVDQPKPKMKRSKCLRSSRLRAGVYQFNSPRKEFPGEQNSIALNMKRALVTVPQKITRHNPSVPKYDMDDEYDRIETNVHLVRFQCPNCLAGYRCLFALKRHVNKSQTCSFVKQDILEYSNSSQIGYKCRHCLMKFISREAYRCHLIVEIQGYYDPSHPKYFHAHVRNIENDDPNSSHQREMIYPRHLHHSKSDNVLSQKSLHSNSVGHKKLKHQPPNCDPYTSRKSFNSTGQCPPRTAKNIPPRKTGTITTIHCTRKVNQLKLKGERARFLGTQKASNRILPRISSCNPANKQEPPKVQKLSRTKISASHYRTRGLKPSPEQIAPELCLLAKCSEVSSLRKKCLFCSTSKTPLWRNGPNGKKTLCNACAMYYQRHGSFDNRDVNWWRRKASLKK